MPFYVCEQMPTGVANIIPCVTQITLNYSVHQLAVVLSRVGGVQFQVKNALDMQKEGNTLNYRLQQVIISILGETCFEYMQKMQILVNYVDPQHYTLSQVLNIYVIKTKTRYDFIWPFPETLYFCLNANSSQ